MLIDPVDPDDVAQGLMRVLESPASWQRYSEAGHHRILSRYTWERTAAGYAGVLEELIARKDAPKPASRLSIPPYFVEPGASNDFTTAELAAIYEGRI